MRSTPHTPPRRRPALAALLLASSLALAGCSGGGAAGAGDSSAARKAAPGAARQEDAAAGATAEKPQAQASEGPEAADITPAQIIRTASVTVSTEDVPGDLAEVRTLVENAGGYVSDEATDSDPGGNERSRVTLRVPPEEYERVLGRLSEDLGEELLERKVSARDVTDQVVDTESRIESQQASVERVRRLMDDATQLTDVVTLESELSTRQANLEALQARLKSLREQTGMSTITLVLLEPDAEPVVAGDDEPTIGGAFAGGWEAFVTMLRWIVIVFGAALPFLLAALALALVWRVARGRLPRRPARTPVPAPAVPAQGSAPAPGDDLGADHRERTEK